ncbi:hypothetical protein OS493_003952 [Desmophyllum pertusum]|uniref:Uncharacterized protein n=1 Tax=Desmophyllum pertusum TaxID=174260 RepID=A0A9W9ZT37_9CNID|nr:hypothetical protein OS493_003952 [Desmophyllum pertusum]
MEKNQSSSRGDVFNSLSEVIADEQVTQTVEQKKTVAKRDEVFYNNVGSVKNSYSIEEEKRRSAENQENEDNQAESTGSESLYYGSFYPRDFDGREYELYYPDNPTYGEWYGPFEPPEEYYENEGDEDYKRSLGPRGGRSAYYGPRGGRSVYYGPRGGRSVESEAGPRGGDLCRTTMDLVGGDLCRTTMDHVEGGLWRTTMDLVEGDLCRTTMDHVEGGLWRTTMDLVGGDLCRTTMDHVVGGLWRTTMDLVEGGL